MRLAGGEPKSTVHSLLRRLQSGESDYCSQVTSDKVNLVTLNVGSVKVEGRQNETEVKLCSYVSLVTGSFLGLPHSLTNGHLSAAQRHLGPGHETGCLGGGCACPMFGVWLPRTCRLFLILRTQPRSIRLSASNFDFPRANFCHLIRSAEHDGSAILGLIVQMQVPIVAWKQGDTAFLDRMKIRAKRKDFVVGIKSLSPRQRSQRPPALMEPSLVILYRCLTSHHVPRPHK